jgi:hypothetical protein
MTDMLAREWRRDETGIYVPFVHDDDYKLTQTAAAPMSMSHLAFLSAGEREVGLAGNRGGGKTRALLMDAAANVGRGYGARARMVIIRPSQREFTDLIKEADDIFRPVWGKHYAFNRNKNFFEWGTGEVLELSYFDTPDDFGLYQGKSYIWIGFEELSLWSDLRCYFLMFSVLRSTLPTTVLRKMRFTCNPNGPAHNAIKYRFGLSGIPNSICGPRITEVGEDGVEASRRMIFCSYEDNVLLRRTEPHYMRDIEQACAGDKAQLMAWKYGSWDIASGGAFDDVFFAHGDTIYEPPFTIPPSGQCFLAYDDGQSRPWACLFLWINTEGCDVIYNDGTAQRGIPGDVHVIGECYGWSGKPDEGRNMSIPEIVSEVRTYEIKQGWRWRDVMTGKWKGLFKSGVADNAIFSPGRGDELSNLSEEFLAPVKIAGEVHPGINFEPADKSPGSRKRGYILMRERLIATGVPQGLRRREAKALFVVKDMCPNFARTIPVLQRSKKDRDDVNDEDEAHIFDACRYGLTHEYRPVMTTGRRWYA